MKVQARFVGIRHSQQSTVTSKSSFNDEEKKKLDHRKYKLSRVPFPSHKETAWKKTQRKSQTYPKAKQNKIE